MADVTPAAQWKQGNRKLVTLPSGNTVMLRRLTAGFLFAIQEIAEKHIVAAEMGSSSVRMDARQQRMYVHALLREGVIAPKIAPDDREPKDDEISVLDLGTDLDPLVKEIHAYNGDVLAPFRAPETSPTAPQAEHDVRGESQPVETPAA